jgi:hypothetical protein
MKRFGIVVYDDKMDEIYRLSEFADTRMQALTQWVNYPNQNPLRDKMHQIEIFEEKRRY